jgi:hypothetical protein
VCKASVDQGPNCRRCKADLALLLALDRQRGRMLRQARESLAAGRPEQALPLASAAHGLRHGDDSARLLALCHLLRGDFRRAWQAYSV